MNEILKEFKKKEDSDHKKAKSCDTLKSSFYVWSMNL